MSYVIPLGSCTLHAISKSNFDGFVQQSHTVTDVDDAPAPSQWQCTLNKNLHQYLVEETAGQMDNDKSELLKL